MAYLALNILLLVVPGALLVFLAPPSHALGAAYLAANYGLCITRFLVALLHVSEHRRLFRPGARFACTLALAPFLRSGFPGNTNGNKSACMRPCQR